MTVTCIFAKIYEESHKNKNSHAAIFDWSLQFAALVNGPKFARCTTLGIG